MEFCTWIRLGQRSGNDSSDPMYRTNLNDLFRKEDNLSFPINGRLYDEKWETLNVADNRGKWVVVCLQSDQPRKAEMETLVSFASITQQ